MVQESFGVMSFPGINQIISGNYSLIHGISPGVAQLVIAPQLNFIGTGGDFVIAFDSVRIVLPNSRLDKHSFRNTPNGFTWRLDILDRRWKWRFPTISGTYNLRDEGNNLVKDSEKTPQELAKLLLEAMEEKNFKVEKLPNDTRPKVDWDFTNAANALASLCDSLGCRVVMHLNSRVELERVGIGKTLPVTNLSIADNSGSIDPPERPGKLKVVGAQTRFQSDFNLFPVGLDTDGRILPIEELSYRPDAGWAGINPDKPFDTTWSDLEFELAEATLFRWYRIEINDHTFESFDDEGNVLDSEVSEGVFTKNFNDGPWDGELIRLDQILPLENAQIDTRKEFGIDVPKLPEIWGVWSDGQFGVFGTDVNVTDKLVPYEKAIRANTALGDPEKTFYTKPIKTLDTKRGIVMFDEPLFSGISNPVSGVNLVASARLAIRLAVKFRDSETRAFQHFELERKIGPDDTKAQIIKREEITLQRKMIFGVMDEFKRQVDVTDNVEEANKEANRFLDTKQKTLNEIAKPQTIGYNGIIPIDVDGSIHQVTWTVGSGGARTRASFNEEQETVIEPFRVRRQNEKLPSELIAIRAKVEQMEARDRLD